MWEDPVVSEARRVRLELEEELAILVSDSWKTNLSS
jgi:hypothetical protein